MPELRMGTGRYMVDGILLDKDGTLLDFMSLWGNWSLGIIKRFATALELRGLSLPAELTPSLWGLIQDSRGVAVDYDRNGPLAMGTLDDLLALLAWQGYTQGLSWAEARELAHACRISADEMLERERPVLSIPGVVGFLEQCRKLRIPLAVVTADETEPAERHLEWLGIRDYFAVVLGTDKAARGKPFPDLALLACSELGIAPSRTAIIGDTNGDMIMAKAAGAAAAIGIDTSGDAVLVSRNLQDADVIVHSYEEMEFGGMER
ncbi:HAD family hydrolase [Paenibacillus sp. GCM10012307]|uniref:HAD family phosphatase n=1 Tax=Paenibacillus roseus TaxID=2798579 RepID=A0A934J7H5_9BACL|nr:HAD family phosphatase [Paenibacillus roseus]MBJ6362151.1 HAD family phosphatase [Paenibacillus roseus]